MKHLFFTLVIFAASVGAAAEPADLKSLLAQKIIVLDRPLTTFHYRSWNYDPKSQAEAWSLVRDAASNFWRADLDKDPNAVGPGFYTSVDSAATRGYGNAFPQLYAVTLKKGARVLDSRTMSQKENDQLKAIGAKFNCFQDSRNSYADYGRLRISGSVQCQAEYMKAAKELQIDAVMYGYSAANNLEGCRSSRDIALDIISVSNIDPSGVAFYSPKTRLESDPKEGSLVLKLFNEGMTDPNLNRYMSDPSNRQTAPASLLTGPTVSQAEYDGYKAQYIWKCGDERASELTAGDKFQENTRKLLNGGGYQNALNDMSKAYQKRFKTTMSLSPKDLRGLVYMQYRASGMAKDDSKWKQWLLATVKAPMALASGPGIDTEKQLKEVSDLFEEKPEVLSLKQREERLNEVIQNFLNPDVDYFVAYPGVLYTVLKSLGAGPRVTSAIVNAVNPIPVVIGPIPKNPRKNYTDFMMKNRDYIVRFYRQCTDEYNSTKTDDQILNGECGNMATEYMSLQAQIATPMPTPPPRPAAQAPIYRPDIKIMNEAPLRLMLGRNAVKSER